MNEFEINLNGDIGWEITLESLTPLLAEAGGKDLIINLTSPGGDVAEITGIYNALEMYAKDNNANITFKIVGWVQSAASYLTTIPNSKTVVFDNSGYMYHNPWMYAMGDYNELSKDSNSLKNITINVANGYSNKSGMDKKEVLEKMSETTILFGQEIIDAGFADELFKNDNADNVIDMSDKKSIFASAKNQHLKTKSRLVAVALGKDYINNNIKKEVSNKLQKKTESENMSENKKTEREENEPISVDDKGRAVACMNAQSALPDKHDVLTKHFEAGMSADFFNGMVAMIDMQKEAQKLKESKDESIDIIAEKSDLAETKIKTAGAIGATVEV